MDAKVGAISPDEVAVSIFFKKLEKDKAISEDDAKKGYDEVQKITDAYSIKIDDAVKAKEAELLKV